MRAWGICQRRRRDLCLTERKKNSNIVTPSSYQHGRKSAVMEQSSWHAGPSRVQVKPYSNLLFPKSTEFSAWQTVVAQQTGNWSYSTEEFTSWNMYLKNQIGALRNSYLKGACDREVFGNYEIFITSWGLEYNTILHSWSFNYLSHFLNKKMHYKYAKWWFLSDSFWKNTKKITFLKQRTLCND